MAHLLPLVAIQVAFLLLFWWISNMQLPNGGMVWYVGSFVFFQQF